MKPSVSLCMIVKNEEKVLARCLDSVQGLVDEIVVVDTGSTDRTKEIAGQYTTLIYDYEWKQDFSDARNFAGAKAGGDWIFVLDADEYVDRGNLADVVDNLGKTDAAIDVLSAQIYNFTGNYAENLVIHTYYKFYRNRPDLYYYRALHEQLKKTDGEIVIGESGLIVYHTGYLPQVYVAKIKDVRNRLLLDKERKSSKHRAFDYFNHANEISGSNPKEALYWYQKAFMKKTDIRMSWVSFCLVKIIQCLMKLRRFEDALKVIDDAEKLYEKTPDFPCLRGLVFFAQTRYDDARAVFTTMLRQQGAYEYPLVVYDYRELQPQLILGEIFLKRKEYDQAVTHFVAVLNQNPKHPVALYKLLDALLQQESPEAVYAFLHKTSWFKTEQDTYPAISLLLNLSGLTIADKLLETVAEPVVRKGFAMKRAIISGDFDAVRQVLLSPDLIEINQMLQAGCFDIYDLILLCMEAQDARLTTLVMTLLPDGDVKTFFGALFSAETLQHEAVYLGLLERSIRLGKLPLFEELWSKKGDFGAPMTTQIGNLLFQLDLADAAMQAYQTAQAEHVLDADALNNIVAYFSGRGETDAALTFLFLALEENAMNFQMYKQGIELLEKIGERNDQLHLIQMAKKQYPDSNWLQQLSIKANS